MAESVELVRTQLNQSLEKKSLTDLVKARSRRSILLVDVSDSMNAPLRSGQTRIAALRDVVGMLRDEHPVPVAAFHENGTRFVDGIPGASGMTPLHEGIEFARRQGATHAVVVTDGHPDSPKMALQAAREFGGVIDVFYVGDGDDEGAKFAQKLAAATGGTANVSDITEKKQLTTNIKGLLGPMTSL